MKSAIAQPEAIRRLLIFQELDQKAPKHDTRTPDALGDRMRRCAARYRYGQQDPAATDESQAALVAEAEALLGETPNLITT